MERDTAVAYGLVALLAVVGVLVVTGTAHAADYTQACSDTGVWDPAVCERTQQTAAELSVASELLHQAAVALWFLFGGVLMLIAAPMMWAAFRWWRA